LKAPLEILEDITASNCEAVYQVFYPACQSGNFDAAQVVVRINQVFRRARDPVLRSYCYLLLGAVVDSGILPENLYQEITGFLVQELRGLTDFSLADNHGRYIHYLSHMGYLAGSLRDHTDIGELYNALLGAYLRADVPICANEDVVIAEVLLGAPHVAGFLPRLESQKQQGTLASHVISEANKRALWMAMFVLNERLEKQDSAIFTRLIEDLVAMVQD